LRDDAAAMETGAALVTIDSAPAKTIRGARSERRSVDARGAIPTGASRAVRVHYSRHSSNPGLARVNTTMGEAETS